MSCDNVSVQFLNDYDITYCPEHVFYDVRVSYVLVPVFCGGISPLFKNNNLDLFICSIPMWYIVAAVLMLSKCKTALMLSVVW